MRLRYVAAAKTDVGQKRQGNEDRFCLDPSLGLYVVADGMGGHAAGEVASRLAVETIQEWMGKYLSGADAAIVGPADAGSAEANFLLSSIRLANRIIFDPRKAAASTRHGDHGGRGSGARRPVCAGPRRRQPNLSDPGTTSSRSPEIIRSCRSRSITA
jgi:hypothetical protein